jgi:antitoxin ParD1/3/4
VLREGLRLVEERRAEHAATLARLRAAVDVGIADSEAGRVTCFESGEELQAHLKSTAAKAIADGLAER